MNSFVSDRCLRCTGALAVAFLFARVGCAKVEIEAMKHDIQLITAQNFDGVIGKFRDAAVASLWFFNADNKQDVAFLDTYNGVATDLKGMAKVCAISCTDFPVFCKKNDVKETPTVMMYPLNPIPAYKWEGKMETKALAGRLGKLIPDSTVRLAKDNIDTFLTTDPTKPKVILASNKKTVPLIWKALSSEVVFKKTVKFGFAIEEDTDIISRLKVKKFPTVLMQRGSKAEIKETYSGEMKFNALKEWINRFSEAGTMDKTKGTGPDKEESSIEDSKPWLVQEIPELTAKSHQDICFKGEGLCVIYIKDGETTQQEIEMLTGLSQKFTSQLSDRGAKMKWMWMNVAVESAFKEMFDAPQLPSAIVFNPHKRLRFTKLDHGEEGEVKGDEAGITKLMDKVLGGDARFQIVKGQKLPAWAVREAKDKKKSEL